MKNRLVRALAALVFLCAAAGAHAAFPSPDPTGLWFDPAQPGWGVQVARQGDTLFVAVFTYDANHTPTWFVAPQVTQIANEIDPIPPFPVFGGTLYRTSGPAFSAATFDPHAVTATPVGNLFLHYDLPNNPGRLVVGYNVDNANVLKTVQPQTWSVSARDLIGSYGGGLFVTGPSRCPSVPLPLPIPPQPMTFSVAAGNPADNAHIVWGSGVDVACTIDATYTRQGQLATLQGSPACGPVGNTAAPTGTLTISAITSNAAGFFGSARLEMPQAQAEACVYEGSFGGTLAQSAERSGLQPDPTGIWFDPAESGWGLAITQQGGTSVAVLFVYGTDGKPAWYVASNVIDTGHGVNTLVQEAFAGTLYRTTGPYYGSDTDTTVLGATAAGTLQVAFIGGTDKLDVAYTVAGTAVHKTVQRETWGSNAALLHDSFTGGLFPSTGTACGSTGLFATTPVTLITTTDPSSGSIRFSWGTGTDTACVLDTTYTQTGQLASLAGPLKCGPIGNPTATLGTVTIFGASVAEKGFAGFAGFSSGGCATGGFVGGVRH